MSEPYLTQIRRELLPGRKKSRMLKELEQHIEDSDGTSDRLGPPKDVAVLYNAIYPLWPRFLCFFCLVFVTSVLIFFGGYMLRLDETPMEAQFSSSPFAPVIGILGFAGILLMFPGIYVSAAIFLPTQNFETHFLATPIIANVIWMVIYAVILLPSPGQIFRLFARRLKS